jgi:hypothetical protein
MKRRKIEKEDIWKKKKQKVILPPVKLRFHKGKDLNSE